MSENSTFWPFPGLSLLSCLDLLHVGRRLRFFALKQCRTPLLTVPAFTAVIPLTYVKLQELTTTNNYRRNQNEGHIAQCIFQLLISICEISDFTKKPSGEWLVFNIIAVATNQRSGGFNDQVQKVQHDAA
jgi:hypothetical protein